MQRVAWRAAGLFFLLAPGLCGCATALMSQQDCLAGDWYSAGLEDGVAGRIEAVFDQRVAQCADYDAPPADGGAYNQGREFGLAQLCTESGGEQFGRSGDVYRGVCREGAEEAFFRGYLPGRRIYRYEAAVSDAAVWLASARLSLSSIRYDITASRRTLKDKEASEEDKLEAQKDLERALERLPDAIERVAARVAFFDQAQSALYRAINGDAAWRASEGFRAALAMISAAHQMARRDPAVHSCTDDVSLLSMSCRVSAGMTVTDDATGQICAVGPGELEMTRRRVVGLVAAPEYVAPFEFYRDGPGSLREAFFGREADGEVDALVRDGTVLELMCPFGVFPTAE